MRGHMCVQCVGGEAVRYVRFVYVCVYTTNEVAAGELHGVVWGQVFEANRAAEIIE